MPTPYSMHVCRPIYKVTSTFISHSSEHGGGVRLNVCQRTRGMSTGFTVITDCYSLLSIFIGPYSIVYSLLADVGLDIVFYRLTWPTKHKLDTQTQAQA